MYITSKTLPQKHDTSATYLFSKTCDIYEIKNSLFLENKIQIRLYKM